MRKYFKCPEKHLIGEVIYLLDGTRILFVFETSKLDTEIVDDISTIDLRGRLVGDMYDVKCTICGKTRDWFVDYVASLTKKNKLAKIKKRSSAF